MSFANTLREQMLDCPIVKPVSGVLSSGTLTLNVWTPTLATGRFRLRYIYIGSTVTTTLAASTSLNLYEGTVGAGTLIFPLAVYSATAAAGTVLTLPANFGQLPTPGIRAAAAGTTLIIATNVSPGTGQITISGVVGGIED